ncbi:MAG TPA: hypothetical protein VNF04_11145 [Stellaceae bacterium]|nr:hypothetical protein [Stellaceae bacterium]
MTTLNFPSARFAAAIAGAAAGAALAAVGVAAAPAATTITCTNPASGASWQLKIDYAHSTVDANAASIGDATITWHDAKDGGNYTLDRKSGSLTFVAPSSTGGYFIYDRCRLETPG